MVVIEKTITKHVGVLIHTTDLEITNYLKTILAPLQLAPEQHLIIALLLKEEGLSQNQIAVQLNKDKSSVARMLDSLEKKGFLIRAKCPVDHRSSKIFLTEAGKELKDAVENISTVTRELISKGLTEEEIGELKRLLMIIRKNVSQQ
ncbi:MarR family winged helix-turn-helix transcriptional regulator [Bacillus sp. 1P06AnD]|uniref:MarR family winged helix-turn-helix transcriptional regulator n=1 Tax=Bacillus sp. 1P06AnD TaxID=3132208 RepID=UPI0039A05D2E